MSGKTFGSIVRNARLLQRLRLAETARALDVSTAALSAVELGRKPVPEYWLPVLVKHLRLDEETAHSLYSLACVERSAARLGLTAGIQTSALAVAHEAVVSSKPEQLELFQERLSVLTKEMVNG